MLFIISEEKIYKNSFISMSYFYCTNIEFTHCAA